MNIFDDDVLNTLNLCIDGVFIENLNGDILMCNATGAEMFGYTVEEITQLNIRDFVPPEETYYLKDEYAASDLYPTEYIRRVNIKKDGTLIFTEVNSKIIISNGVEYIIAFVRNGAGIGRDDPRAPAAQMSTTFWQRIKEEENQIVLPLYDSVGKVKSIIPLTAVEYIESNLKKLRFCLTDGSILEGYGTLNHLEESIPSMGSFLRCYQSNLINMQYAELDEQHGIFIMQSGARVPIRKRQYRQIKQVYYNYRIMMK